ncbi:MAG: V-type ATP synthase subunit A [Fervidicoccaceae archaeon]|nr:V-type ATP synthase subunit A [Fervidicoccaceae archaeon]
MSVGRVIRISGPLVVAEDMLGSLMYEMVEVGEDRLIGEINRIDGDKAYIQVYESTSGLRPGEPVYRTGSPLSVELGPGLLTQIFDGIQRPLPIIAGLTNSIFVKRGVKASSLPREKKWYFKPRKELVGQKVSEGTIIGEVAETSVITHKVMVPPGIRGTLKSIVSEGEYTIDDVIAVVDGETGRTEVKMYHRWPARFPRPYHEKLEPTEPLITGVRILDTLFPLAKGGTAAIPGPFGSGKTVTLHSLAKWSDANVVVYIGCGERGNEMTEVLEKFPEYTDPWTGKPLMERTILIANTSNMPVAAREASIYVGITMAEYYRDMGYNVLLVADSTSRWAEALREIGGRLEEMPAEEGFPSYLASRIAEFYERAGKVIAKGDPSRVGSVTVVGAVSPPGGDFTEPVVMHTRRFIKVFWALDASLAYSRHYPAINWLMSYSGYIDTVSQWWSEKVSKDWLKLREKAMNILLREDSLREIVRLMGTEGLSEQEKAVLFIARIIKDGFLKQNAYDKIDAFSAPKKQYLLLKAIINIYQKILEIINAGKATVAIIEEEMQPLFSELIRARYTIPNEQAELIQKLEDKIIDSLAFIAAR